MTDFPLNILFKKSAVKTTFILFIMNKKENEKKIINVRKYNFNANENYNNLFWGRVACCRETHSEKSAK